MVPSASVAVAVKLILAGAVKLVAVGPVNVTTGAPVAAGSNVSIFCAYRIPSNL